MTDRLLRPNCVGRSNDGCIWKDDGFAVNSFPYPSVLTHIAGRMSIEA